MIVQRVQGRRRIVNAEGGLQIAAADEIFGAPCRAAVLDVGIAGVPAAHIGADLPDVVEIRGRDVHDTRRAQPVLRRQRAGDQAQAADPAGIQVLTKCAEAVGQENAVDPI